MDEWHPPARPGSVRVAEMPDRGVQRWGGSCGYEFTVFCGEIGVDHPGDLGGGLVVYRPQGCEDVPVAGVVQCGGEADCLVRQRGAACGALAGGQECELGAAHLSAEI